MFSSYHLGAANREQTIVRLSLVVDDPQLIDALLLLRTFMEQNKIELLELGTPATGVSCSGLFQAQHGATIGIWLGEQGVPCIC